MFAHSLQVEPEVARMAALPGYKRQEYNGIKLMSRYLAVAVCVGLMVAAMIPVAQADDDARWQVIPRDANTYGNSSGEWSARWWQWALSIPAATNPVLDETGANCAEGQSGPVWFLASAFGGIFTAERICMVPPGKALFFPINQATFGAAVGDCEPTKPGVLCNITVLRAAAAASMDPVTLEASIDGVPVRHLRDYRVQSPVFSVTLPEGNVVDVPSGTYAPMVSDGYWLMLAPLSAGTHTIHFKSSITSGPFAGNKTEITYHLTVGR
jgi:hypothetical protein